MTPEGLFETILVREGRPVRLTEHLERMERSARTLGVAVAPPFSEIRRRCEESATDVALGRMRVRATGAGVEIAVDPVPPVDRELIRRGAVALLAPVPGHPLGNLAGHKVLPYDSLVAARREAERRGAFEVVFVGGDGAFLEGAASNLFLVLDETVATPPLERRILPGTTRRAALEAARAAGWETRERDLGPEEAARATEAFLTGSLMEVMPLRRLGAARFSAGPVAQEIRRAVTRG